MNASSHPEPSGSLTPSRFPRIVETLAGFFASRDAPAYLVGGVVRDALLDRRTADVDLAAAGDTSELASDMASVLGTHAVSLDAVRGIVRMVVPGPKVTIVDLGPIYGGIEDDLARRDFALDAMAVSLADFEAPGATLRLIDPHGGLADLMAGVIRALAPSVFDDDPARLMRGPRLAAQLGFSLTDETARWTRDRAGLVTAVAPERVRDELMKLMAAPSASASLRMLDDLGLLGQLIPELEEARGVSQPKEHHWDVFDHSIETAGQVERFSSGSSDAEGFVERLLPHFPSFDEYFAESVSDGHTRLTLLKFAGLLHDIGKPSTKTVEPTGRVRFLGHGHRGAEMAARVSDRLRLSSRGSDLVCRMVEHHLRPSQLSQNEALPTGRAVYRYYRDLGPAAVDTIYLSLADYLAARGPNMREPEWRDRCRVVGHVLYTGLEPGSAKGDDTLINGHEIMQTFALTPGPRIGVLLEVVREAQADGDIGTKEEALDLVRSSIDSGGARE